MNEQNFEGRTLTLLIDSHAELSNGLNSLGGKVGRGHIDNYKFYCSAYMGHASQGFIVLRTRNGLPESRFLVRPAIEMMLKLRALQRRPDLIYRIGLTEVRDDRTWLRAVAKHVGQSYDEVHYEMQLQRFKEACM